MSNETIFTLSSYQIKHLTILITNLTMHQIFFTSEGDFGIIYELEGTLYREVIPKEKPEDNVTLSS